MKNIILKTLTRILFVLSALFLGLSLYYLDMMLFVISVLFAIAGLIVRLQTKELLLNPFED